MSTVFQKYAAVLLPFLILVVGASQTILADPTNWSSNITFGIVVVGAVVTYLLRLVPLKWQGALKTGAAIVTAVLSAVLPFVLPGGFVPDVNLPVVFVAVLNAIAVELGVQIRVSDAPLANGSIPDRDSVKPHATHAHTSRAA